MIYQRTTIVFVTRKLNGGGAERSLLEVFRALNRRYFIPMLWRLDPLNLYPGYLSKSDSTEVLPLLPKTRKSADRVKRCIERLPPHLKKTRPAALIADSLRLFDRIRRLHCTNSAPTILVSSQLSMNVNAAIVQWLCRYRVPVVFIEQNEPYMRYKSIESSSTCELAWTRIRQMYPSATHVVTVSEAARKSLQINFNIEKKRITSIPNPVHLKRIHSYLKRYTPNHPFYFQKQPVIICVARFHPLKNHLMLLRSFALVRKTTPVKLILLGQGSQRKVIERIIVEMGLSREVAVIDFKSRPYAFLANADISVLASYSEGQGLAVVESLACGVPVVCTNWKGVRELIHHGVNGIVCHMRDDALAAGLLAGLKLAKIRATQTAAEISAQKFDLPQIVEKYETLFFRLVRPSTNATLF